MKISLQKDNDSVVGQSALSHGSKTQHPSGISFTFKHHGKSPMLSNYILLQGLKALRG